MYRTFAGRHLWILLPLTAFCNRHPCVRTIGSAVCSKAYIWILCIFHFFFLIPQILLCCSVFKFILKKKKLTLNSPSTACRISRVRSCWTLMYKPLLILEYEFHHTRHWFVSENGSLFCVMLITTDWRTGWCNGVHQSLKKEASVNLFVRLSSAFNVCQGFHSEMRSTDTNWC